MRAALQFIVLICAAAALVIAGLAFRQPPGTDPLSEVVKASAWPPVVLWFVAMFGLVPRLAWPVGCGLFLLHIAVAFHAAHGWSHASAFDHVERTSGFGPGIFMSYLFALAWTADAVFLALRRRHLGIVVLLFMAFIVFNATVVYGHGPVRYLGAIGFAMLAWQWIGYRARSQAVRSDASNERT